MHHHQPLPWRLQRQEELRLPASAFLGPTELKQLNRLTVIHRRRDWLLGRYTAKALIRSHLRWNLPMTRIRIWAGADGAPRANVDGMRLGLSISHRAGWSLCALPGQPGQAVGADVELIEPRSPRFVQDFFTTAERRQVGGAVDRDAMVTALWSAKESALKALHLGLTVDTRRMECRLAAPAPGSWVPLSARFTPAEGGAVQLHGWWRRKGSLVLSLVTTG